MRRKASHVVDDNGDALVVAAPVDVGRLPRRFASTGRTFCVRCRRYKRYRQVEFCDLEAHIGGEHFKLRPFVCRLCGRSGASAKEIQSHTRSSHPGVRADDSLRILYKADSASIAVVEAVFLASVCGFYKTGAAPTNNKRKLSAVAAGSDDRKFRPPSQPLPAVISVFDHHETIMKWMEQMRRRVLVGRRTCRLCGQLVWGSFDEHIRECHFWQSGPVQCQRCALTFDSWAKLDTHNTGNVLCGRARDVTVRISQLRWDCFRWLASDSQLPKCLQLDGETDGPGMVERGHRGLGVEAGGVVTPANWDAKRRAGITPRKQRDSEFARQHPSVSACKPTHTARRAGTIIAVQVQRKGQAVVAVSVPLKGITSLPDTNAGQPPAKKALTVL